MRDTHAKCTSIASLLVQASIAAGTHDNRNTFQAVLLIMRRSRNGVSLMIAERPVHWHDRNTAIQQSQALVNQLFFPGPYSTCVLHDLRSPQPASSWYGRDDGDRTQNPNKTHLITP